MARPSWSGLLQFSLVGIPLKAFPAVRTRDVPSANLLHAECGERIRYAKQCPVHSTVDSAAIVKGYEYGPGRHVIAQPDELGALPRTPPPHARSHGAYLPDRSLGAERSGARVAR
jgi:DNA end-binding protein Ku